MDEPGADLDRRVVRTLFDDWPEQIPQFSTRDSAADYLLRFLKRRGVGWRVRLAGGTWECELSGRSGVISSGTGETRALAISRAVVHADVVPGRRRTAAGSADEAGKRRRGKRAIVRDCALCGVALKTARSAPRGVRYCNLCGWRQIRIFPEERAS